MNPASRPVRILLVDEEETLTDIVTMAFELEGWQVAVARTGADALADTSDPDVILLDVALPDADGTEVLRGLRAAGSTATVLFLTGRATHDDRMAGYAAGADGYLTKPFGLEELVDQVAAVVRRLGLAPSSRRLGELLLDTEAGMAWRGGELLPLTPLEVEVLRDLIDNRGTPMTTGQLITGAARRGIRIPRELLGRMLDRIRALVTDAGAILQRTEAGWMLA